MTKNEWNGVWSCAYFICKLFVRAFSSCFDWNCRNIIENLHKQDMQETGLKICMDEYNKTEIGFALIKHNRNEN